MIAGGQLAAGQARTTGAFTNLTLAQQCACNQTGKRHFADIVRSADQQRVGDFVVLDGGLQLLHGQLVAYNVPGFH
jgi:hypothetical protein